MYYLNLLARQFLLKKNLLNLQTYLRLSTTSDWSDIDESNFKRSLKKVRLSGFESESDQISTSLAQLSNNLPSEWEPWNDLKPRGQLTNAIPLRDTKDKSIYDRKKYFVDCKKVKCEGGKGGDGKIAFLRLFCNAEAGPSGGDGGNGGHVIFEASHQIKSLDKISSCYIGESGENGMEKNMHGRNAKHTYIYVPIGTLVKVEKTNRIVADLDEDGIKLIAARGGAGGKGNHYFLSNTNRHPSVAELGARGDLVSWVLEMKIVAHAGLVGMPNSGKSTILRAISRAKPKVASYPFTTLKPNLGIVQYDDYEQIAVADMPGLITGAHQNKGLGVDFLRHIERCVCLFYVIDISEQQPWQKLDILMFELEQYKTGLSKRPSAIICNKIDLPNSQDNLVKLKQHLTESDFKIIPISAKYGHNITELLKYLRELYDLYNFKEDTGHKLIW